MKKTNQKLSLNRDTIRRLGDTQLHGVQGGAAGNTVGACGSAATCFSCNTCATNDCTSGGGGVTVTVDTCIACTIKVA